MKHSKRVQTISNEITKLAATNDQDFKAKLEDLTTELGEIHDQATRADTAQAVVKVLEGVLENLEGQAHEAVFMAKLKAEREAQGIEAPMTRRLDEITKELGEKATHAVITGHLERAGCTAHHGLVTRHILETVKPEPGTGIIPELDEVKLQAAIAELRLNPSFSMLFEGNSHTGRISTSNPALANGGTYTGINPWMKESLNLTKQGQITMSNPALAERLKAEAKAKEQPRATTATRTDGNPWMKESLNLTRQGQIARENPALAKRLAAEAGKVLWGA